MKYSIFGCGNSIYEDNFNKVAKDLNANFQKLGDKKFLNLILGDDNVSRNDSKTKDIEMDFKIYSKITRGMTLRIYETFLRRDFQKLSNLQQKSSQSRSTTKSENDQLANLEDIGDILSSQKPKTSPSPVESDNENDEPEQKSEPKHEMVTENKKNFNKRRL